MAKWRLGKAEIKTYNRKMQAISTAAQHIPVGVRVTVSFGLWWEQQYYMEVRYGV